MSLEFSGATFTSVLTLGDTLFAGSYNGIFRSLDGWTNWSTMEADRLGE